MKWKARDRLAGYPGFSELFRDYAADAGLYMIIIGIGLGWLTDWLVLPATLVIVGFLLNLIMHYVSGQHIRNWWRWW